ncbi:MAG: alpha/beta fold hydrolase [Pseudomonadota bacterium]|nr:alpha/beta fold hydrolase [Pseudomonadota bacterium]
MNAATQREFLTGPAGKVECAIDLPPGTPRGTAVICHPHPQAGGTLDNKVVQTLARAFVQLGWRSVRFNFRGVGASEGAWNDGVGEIDDALAVIQAYAAERGSFILAGFSFGAFVASHAAARLAADEKPWRMVLVGPSTAKQPMAPVPADSLVIHGEIDDVVPLAATLDWARPQALPVVVFPGVGHFFHGQLGLLKNTVMRDLRSCTPL